MRTLILAASIVAVAGCTSLTPAEDPVYLKLTDLEARLVRIEKVFDNDSLIALAQDVERLRTETQQLRGDIETLQFQTDNAADRQKGLYVDLDNRISAIEDGQARIAQEAHAASQATQELQAAAAAAAEPKVPPAPPQPIGTDQDNYNAAFALIQSRQYIDAAAAFREFLAMFPDSPLADNAQYWLAETFFVRGQYKDALPQFQKVIDDYPQSQKVPDAMLKVGYTHYELDERPEARTALQKVSHDYPETTAARLALERLQRMDQESD